MLKRPERLAGRYTFRAPIGRGGMANVWLADDELLRRQVAIKQVAAPSGLGSQVQEAFRDMALREAQTAAQVSHPNVVRIYDVVQSRGWPWIIMEYVPSFSLRQVVAQKGPLAPGYVATVGVALADALAAAHGAGVLHRDLTPQNVLIGHDRRVVLADFGLAIWSGDPGCDGAEPIGTPQYIAPERASSGVSTTAGDLWSLGATLYAAVEGRSPYRRATVNETLEALLTAPPDPPHYAGELEPVLYGLLDKNPARRPSVENVRRALQKVQGSAGFTPPPRPGEFRELAATMPRPVRV